jgi:uncharacterized oligopeptide transporter (OPT) family protein
MIVCLLDRSLAVAFFGVFLSPPIRKQVIIEEQLSFPSGTATAHLISALHDLPPPDRDGGLRHRGGYTSIEADDSSTSEPHPTLNPDEQTTLLRSEAFRHDSWSYLAWSFAASAVMTVSSNLKVFAYFS